MSIFIGGPWQFQPVTPPEPPPPTGNAIPSGIVTLTPQEYLWSDTHDTTGWAPNSVTYRRKGGAVGLGGADIHPGWWVEYAGESAVTFENFGGDWWDASVPPIAQGSVVYATSGNIADTDVARPIDFTGAPLTALVKAFLAGTAGFPNCGFIMLANNSNIVTWYTSRGAIPPTLTITSGGTDSIIPCARSIGIDSSTDFSLETQPTMQTSGLNRTCLIWFDFTGFSIDPATVTAAKITCYNVPPQGGAQTVNIFAVRNANDPNNATMPVQQLGLAANYNLDIGIENHPDVLFCQHFNNGLAFQQDWLCVQGAQFDNCNSFALLSTDDPSQGFTRLGGIYGAIQVIFNPVNQCAYNALWNTWQGTGSQRLPGKSYADPPNELFLRYYVFLPAIGAAPWVPQPQGGKFPGWDGRYAPDYPSLGVVGIPGMARGNSGSGADGITGFSVRGTYASAPPPGSPDENLYSLGAPADVYDLYVGTTSSSYGHSAYVGHNHYLGMMRRGEWHPIEIRLKMNSVTQPTQKPRRLTSLTCSGTVATAVLQNSETDPLFSDGSVWSVGGSQTPPYVGSFPITVVPDGGLNKTFSFTVPAGTQSPAVVWGGGLFAVPSVGNADGNVSTWFDGRLIGSFDFAKFRHTAWTVDGLHNFGINEMWFSIYHGGTLFPSHNFSCMFSEIIVATSYIGPMVIQATLPAWLQGVPLLQWTQPAGSSLTAMPAAELAKLSNAGYCNVDGSQFSAPDGWGLGYSATHGSPTQGIFADSGGTFRNAGSTIILFGGGGAGGWAGNDIRALSLEANNPTWEIHMPPTQSNVSGGVYFQPPGPWHRAAAGAPYAFMQDGISPNARHSYMQGQFHDGMDKFFAIGCVATWETDGGTLFPNVWCCDWQTKAWVPPTSNVAPTVTGWADHPALSANRNGPIQIKDPETEMIYCANASQFREFDPTTNTWTRICYNAARSDAHYGVAAINPNYNENGATGLMFVMGLVAGGFRPQVYELHPGANSWVMTPVGTSAPWFSNLTPGGSTPWLTNGSYGAGMENGFVYCPDRDSFIFYQDDGVMYEITRTGPISSWAINALPLTVAAGSSAPPNRINGDASGVRVLGHMQYVPNLKGVALYLQGNLDCFFFRTG